jgi:Fic family protein
MPPVESLPARELKLPDTVFSSALEVSSLEKKLNSVASPQARELKLTREVVASWAIEGIDLPVGSVQRAVSGAYNDNELRQWLRDDGFAIALAVRFFLEEDMPSLTPENICDVHGMLAPGDARESAEGKSHIGDGPNVWGEIRKTGVHVVNGAGQSVFVGPNPDDVPRLLARFCDWWNAEKPKLPPPIFSALAHLYFVKIHPFGDGNGRMSRLLAAKAGQQTNAPHPYSISEQILAKRSFYYSVLEKADCPDTEHYFVSYILDRQKESLEAAFATVMRCGARKRFWSKYAEEPFSEGQKKLLDAMILSPADEIWDLAQVARVSQDELTELRVRGFIVGGRFNRELVPEFESPPNKNKGARVSAIWAFENDIDPHLGSLAGALADRDFAVEVHNALQDLVCKPEDFGYTPEEVEEWAQRHNATRTRLKPDGTPEILHDDF